jgi:hypothetical protein
MLRRHALTQRSYHLHAAPAQLRVLLKLQQQQRLGGALLVQQGGAQSQLVGANTWSTGFESKALWIESYSMSSSQISSAERIITAMVAVTMAVAVTVPATKTERAHVHQHQQQQLPAAALSFGYRRPRCLAGQVVDWRTATVVMAAAAVRHRPRPRHHYLDSYLRHLQPLMQTDDSDLNLMSARR